MEGPHRTATGRSQTTFLDKAVNTGLKVTFFFFFRDIGGFLFSTQRPVIFVSRQFTQFLLFKRKKPDFCHGRKYKDLNFTSQTCTAHRPTISHMILQTERGKKKTPKNQPGRTHLCTSACHPGSCGRRIPPRTRRAAAEQTEAAGSPPA